MKKETPTNHTIEKEHALRKSSWVAPELLDLDLIRTRGTKDAIGSDEAEQCCGPGGWSDKTILSPS